jgi:hypothetical protein
VADSKCSDFLASNDTIESIGVAQKFLSPAPGTTTKAVFSPSPHLLKPSQMNLKTYSDNLFRKDVVDKVDEITSAKATSDVEGNAEFSKNEGTSKNDSENDNVPGKEDAFTLMKRLNEKYSALLKATSDTPTKTAASPSFQSPQSKARSTIECSPTPHLLKPSQINFKKAYAGGNDCGNVTSKVLKPANLNDRRTDFASRFSDPLSPSDFPTKFSDIVSPQTTSSTDFSPTLTRFLYLNQRDGKESIVSSEKKNIPRKLVTDIATDTEVLPQSDQVFSPLNAQMLSDMIGFTSTFSEAIVSPRKPHISSTMMLRAAVPSTLPESSKPKIEIETTEYQEPLNETDLFSDFASFTPSNFATEEGLSAKSGIMDKVKFFDSPFASDSKIGSANGDETKFAAFDNEWTTTAETTSEDADRTGDDLGKELDDILDTVPGDSIEQQPPSDSIEKQEEHAADDVNNVFFGGRFNEELGTIESIINSPGALNDNLSTIDEEDEDLAAQTKLFKESLTPELSEFYSQINAMFDRKVNNLERKVKSASVENSVIKEEMCHQHQQIQSLMVQLESSRDMLQANQGLMQEIEELRSQLSSETLKSKGGIKGKFFTSKKKINKTLKHIWL